MTVEELKTFLMADGSFAFAKQLNARRCVRSCYVLLFDRRHGFHVMEKSLKQLRSMMEGDLLLIGTITEKGFSLLPPYTGPVPVIPEEEEEALYQKLPKRDFTMQVLERKLMKKIGYF